jgi:ribonuclease VapC
VTVLVDASALVAILKDEPEAEMLTDRLLASDIRLTNGIALWEAARAISRGRAGGVESALAEAERYCEALGILLVPIGAPEAAEAVRAQARYGKGSGHPAQLNMGDCFAYACARTNGARLLYKGDDFSRTDLA